MLQGCLQGKSGDERDSHRTCTAESCECKRLQQPTWSLLAALWGLEGGLCQICNDAPHVGLQMLQTLLSTTHGKQWKRRSRRHSGRKRSSRRHGGRKRSLHCVICRPCQPLLPGQSATCSGALQREPHQALAAALANCQGRCDCLHGTTMASNLCKELL